VQALVQETALRVLRDLIHRIPILEIYPRKESGNYLHLLGSIKNILLNSRHPGAQQLESRNGHIAISPLVTTHTVAMILRLRRSQNLQSAHGHRPPDLLNDPVSPQKESGREKANVMPLQTATKPVPDQRLRDPQGIIVHVTHIVATVQTALTIVILNRNTAIGKDDAQLH
jgi:hypothetical protein